MFKNWKAAACLTITIGLAACAAQPQDTVKDARSIDKSRMLKIIDPELLARMVLLASSAKNCDVETEPFCTIEMKMITHQGKDYCVAVAPDVFVKTHSGGGPGNKRRIVWRLDTASLGGKALAFHDDAGTVITVDKHKQVDPRGKRGDGLGGSVLNHVFHTMTVRNKASASATYLPVILWGPSGEEDLCAAVDPKIVNV